MKKTLMLGSLLAAIPGIAVLGVLATAPEAEANLPQTCETTYFSDATYTMEVGWKEVDQCERTTQSWGVVTSYSRVSCYGCGRALSP